MGRMQAEGMASTELDLDTLLHWHLTSNHYPPHPASMVGPARRAVLQARAGHWNKSVRMPPGVRHRRYGSLVPVSVLVEALHLDTFVTTDQDLED